MLPDALSNKNKEEIISSKKDSSLLLSYYFAPLTDEIIKKSFLYKLIIKNKPDIIIDAINTATVVGYIDDPYSLPRKIIDNNSIENSTIKLLLSNPITPMIRFIQILKEVMNTTNLSSYIKISTTGLGGMGFNLQYTHGDLNETGMSSGLLGKVAVSGIMHQLFWSLSHTPKCNIKVIVPATLIGWQYVGFGDFRSHGKKLQKVSLPKKQKIGKNNKFILEKTELLSDTIKIPYVDSGENNAYSLHEMMAITALGQMEAITREEVADAVLQSIIGSTKYDILTALDNATLNPTYAAAIQRNYIFDKMRKFEKNSNYPSIATNNLGPTVSKHLFELFVLLKISDNSLKKLINFSEKKILVLLKEFFETNNTIIQYALALRLPVLNNDNELLILDNAFVPENKQLLKNVSQENLEKYIESGWVDFREKTIKKWLLKIKKMITEKAINSNKLCITTEKNIHNIKNGDIGEILGYIYSMEGGNRKKELDI